MGEIEVELRVGGDFIGYVSTLKAESTSKDDHAVKAVQPLDAEVQDNTAGTEQGTKRSKNEIIEVSGVHKHAETSSKISEMEFNFVIENLKQELCSLEEGYHLLKCSSNESRSPAHNVMQANAHEEAESYKLDSENQESDVQCLVLVAELETLKVQMQVAYDMYVRLGSEAVALRQEKDDEVSRLSSQIIYLERQLHELEKKHISVLVRSGERIDDEKTYLKRQVACILGDTQKREEELVGMEIYQKQARTMEVEHQDFLSTTETSNAAVHEVEGQSVAMLSEFEQQRQVADDKIADLASELQVSQHRQHELQLQLQGLREENTRALMKASNLGQKVEELKFDTLRLSSELERLNQDRDRREELEVELRVCKGRVESLEVEKLTSVTLVDNLITQVRELEEDKRKLTNLSNEASQSVQHLWDENIRLIEGYNRLEQEKQAHEGDRMELLAGIQTVWEQLHSANEREALLASDLRGLNERRDAEDVLFGQKLEDYELKLGELEQENSDLIFKFEELSQVLEALLQETSLKLNDVQEERDHLVHEVSELVKLKEEAEQAVSVQRISWETQIQVLKSEKSALLSTVEDLEQQSHTSKMEFKCLKEKDEECNQLILELRAELIRLSVEIDKLDEVKERQEGERLELAADLQAAWDLIQALRESKATIATELSELKHLRKEENLRSGELVHDLRRQLHKLEERTSEAGVKAEQLSKRLNELRNEQELQDENDRLGAEIARLEQETDRLLSQKAVLLGDMQALQGRVKGLELDKIKMACEIEELNQWLQGPAAEKKQLAANLDEMTRLFKGLELERSQLTTSVCELQEEKKRMHKDAGKLQDMINVLEEENAKSLLVHEESIRQLESVEQEIQQALRIQEDSALLVQNLSDKIHVLEEESLRITSMHEDLLLRIQSSEEEKIIMGRMLEEQGVELNQIRLEIIGHVDALGELEGKLELKQLEVQLLKAQVSRLEEESLSMRTLHDTVYSRLQPLDIKKSQVESSILSLGAKRGQLLQSLDESELRMQGLIKRNSDSSETICRLEEELMKRSEEIQMIRGRVSAVKEGKENFLCHHKELHENLQAEKLQYITKAASSEIIMEQPLADSQRQKEHIESLSTIHQDTPQLQALTENVLEPTNDLDALNFSVQKLQAEHVEHISKVKSLEGELERKLAEILQYHETLLQLQILDEENTELVQTLNASNLSVYELQRKDFEYTYRLKILEEEVALIQAEVQRLDAKARTLSFRHQQSLLQFEVLKGAKDESRNCFDAFNLFVQKLQLINEQHTNTSKTSEDGCQDLINKLHTENSELVSAARMFEDELYWRREKIEFMDFPVRSLDDKNFREAIEYNDICGGMFTKMKCAKLLEQSELMMKLEMENVEPTTTVSKLEKHLYEENKTFRNLVLSLKVKRESSGQECTAKLLCLEEEKSKLAKVLEDSNLAVADLQTVVDYMKASIFHLGRGKDELANQLRPVQDQTFVIVAERDPLSSEMQVAREQLQWYVERLQTSENVAKKSKGEALELAKQVENCREQVLIQVGYTPPPNCYLVTELETVLDQERLSFGQMEILHLIGAIIDPKTELQQASLGWVKIITTVCQELAKLLCSISEKKGKLARKLGVSHPKTKVLANICQELDRLILGLRERMERFAEELSLLKHKFVKGRDRFSFESDADLNVGNHQQIPTMVAPDKERFMPDVETSFWTLQSTQVEKTEREAHGANLSPCLADSQGRSTALVIKSLTGNPYLLTSRAADGGHRKGLACFSADDSSVLNYGSKLKVGRNIEALEQEKKEKKENATLSSVTQRTQTPGRSFKKCKVNMQQPKRRWIF